MNFYDLIKKLCYSTGVNSRPPNTFGDTQTATIKYKQFLNDALAEIFSEQFNFRKDTLTFSTVAGQSEYTKPVGIIEKLGVRVTGVTNPLTHEKTPYDLQTLSGLPSKYYIQGSKLVLYPTPTDVRTVTIHYLNTMSGLSASNVPQIGLTLETDAPNFSEQFHDLIVLKAELIWIRDKGTKNIPALEKRIQKRINHLIDLDRGTLENSPIIEM